MRDTCMDCPALETKEGEGWCYYYQSWARPGEDCGCGNSFDEKPEFTQEESEIICYQLADKYHKIPIEDMDAHFKKTNEWPEEFNEDIRQATDKAQAEMRQRKVLQ